MTEKLLKTLKDSAVARWTALILLASMMFFAYMFVEVLSPLQSMLEKTRGWDPETYGNFASSEYFLNVFAFFLIFAGIILDKMGVRFTALLSAFIMVLGAGIKLYGISDYFANGGFGYEFFNSFLPSFPASAKVACIGFAIFGCGVEMAGVTISKAIVKWFNGKELALAMGIEMAIARLGVFAVFRMSPAVADSFGSVVQPVAICGSLLCIGLLAFVVYFFMDRKLDQQISFDEEPEEPFKFRDIGKLFKSKTFLIVAFLCVLYYSAIFPFQKFAANMLESRLGISNTEASDIFSWFPIGAMVLTPLLGIFLDRKGKGATMLILGAILMCACHLVFALIPLTTAIAYCAIILLGVSFSLVPAALWPSVPKLVENRYLGSGYSVIFWIQNMGLFLFPIIIGWSLNTTNPGISDGNKNYNILSNYSTYNSSKIINEAATQIYASTNYDEIRNEMQAYIIETSLRNKNPKLQERLNETELKINQIITPEMHDQFIKYAVLVKSSIDEKDKENTSSLLADFQQYITQKISKEQIYELNRYLPFINSNLEFINNKESQKVFIRLNDLSNEMQINNDKLMTAESYYLNADEISDSRTQLSRVNPYNYRVPMLIFASLGVLAFILGIWLKTEDRKKGYGLELPNIQK